MGGISRRNQVLKGFEGLAMLPTCRRHGTAKPLTLAKPVIPGPCKAGPAIPVPRETCSESRTIKNRSVQ